MDCSWPESTPFDRRKAVDELLRGREFAQQLRAHLRRSSGSGGTASEDLISRILTTFSKTISMLNRGSDSDDINGSIVDYSHDESEDSCKSSTPNNDRRGCYKRRKNSHSWVRESCSLVDDGHAWRKYGQKSILNAKFPRNYYRCTHKFDQSCQATKQVQRVEENPTKFRTTYYGHHTCTNFLKASEIVLGSSNTFDDSCGVLLSFDSPPSAVAQGSDHFFLPADADADALVVKKELMMKDQLVIGGTVAADEVCSPSDYMSAAPSSPDHFSEVMMAGSVVDFEDDVLQFDF